MARRGPCAELAAVDLSTQIQRDELVAEPVKPS
jgi:hypothetical protein